MSSQVVDPKKAHQTGCAQIHTVNESVAATPVLTIRISENIFAVRGVRASSIKARYIS